MKSQVLICHAYNTLPSENWYKWLEGVLGERGYDAKVLEFPTPSAPSEEKWVESIKNAHSKDPVILVGHSLGCRAILAYLNQYKVTVEKIILLACPMFLDGVVDTRPTLGAYFDKAQELDFTLISNLVGTAHLFHDTSDPILPMKNVEFLEKEFGEKAVLHISDTYKHFGVPEIPELIELFP